MMLVSEHDAGLDLDLLDKLPSIFERRGRAIPSSRVTFWQRTRILISQIPTACSSISKASSNSKRHRQMNDVMNEIPRIREELGYPPLVTPTSQIVGTQAVLNVLQGERYKTITAETKAILGGYYGKTPAPVDPEIQKKAIGDEKPITCRPADSSSEDGKTFKKRQMERRRT